MNTTNFMSESFNAFHTLANESIHTDIQITGSSETVKKKIGIHSKLLKGLSIAYKPTNVIFALANPMIVEYFVELLYTGSTNITDDKDYEEIKFVANYFGVTGLKADKQEAIFMPSKNEHRTPEPERKLTEPAEDQADSNEFFKLIRPNIRPKIENEEQQIEEVQDKKPIVKSNSKRVKLHDCPLSYCLQEKIKDRDEAALHFVKHFYKNIQKVYKLSTYTNQCPLCSKVLSPRRLLTHIVLKHEPKDQRLEVPEYEKFKKMMKLPHDLDWEDNNNKNDALISEEAETIEDPEIKEENTDLLSEYRRGEETEDFDFSDDELIAAGIEEDVPKKPKKKKYGIMTNRPTCELCKKQFTSKEDLSVHQVLADCTMYINKVIECEECPRKFENYEGLVRHYKKFHPHEQVPSSVFGIKPYSCKFCPKPFSKMHDFKNHVFKFHPQEMKK